MSRQDLTDLQRHIFPAPPAAPGPVFRFPHTVSKKAAPPVGVLDPFLDWSRLPVCVTAILLQWNLPRPKKHSPGVFLSPASPGPVFRFPHTVSKKAAPPVGVPLFWSRVRESNPPSRLGKPLYYRYTNPAYGSIITDRNGNFNLFLSKSFLCLSTTDGPSCRAEIKPEKAPIS